MNEQRKLKFMLIVMLFFLLGLQASLWFSSTGLRNLGELEQDVAEQTRENADLQLRNLTLEAEVEDLKQGLQSVEERARSELGMIGEDETFFLLIEKERSNTNQKTEPNTDDPQTQN